MPSRIVRDGILTSESVCSLSWAEEVFYRRLMSVADDHGRFHAMPKLLRAACYPLQIDKVSDADIGKWTTACVAAGLVSVYLAADGKRYIEISKFGQRVQSKSKFPGAPQTTDIQQKPAEKTDMPQESTVINREPPSKTDLFGVGVGVDLCTEQRGCVGADASPVVLQVPLVDGTEHWVTQADIEGWSPAYPGIDVAVQLHKARVWLEENPKKRKTRAGIGRFLTGWLARSQDSGKDYAKPVRDSAIGAFV